MRVAHFNESGSEDFGCLAVDVEGADLGFSGGCHVVEKYAAFSMDASVVRWLPARGFGGIGRAGTEKVMAAGAAARFGRR